jgi:hypothetical protein
MPNVFSSTGGAAHSTAITGLTNGGSYNYFVRCQDTAGNANTTDFTISFSVAQTSVSGLVAAYGFNEGSGTTAADFSGSGHVATLLGGATWTTEGRFGSSLVVNGTTAYAQVADHPSLRLTGPFTLSTWVYPTASLSEWRGLIEKLGDAYFLHSRTSINGGAPGIGRITSGGSFNEAFAWSDATSIREWYAR